MNLFSFVDEVLKRIHDKRNSLSEQIINGSVKDIEHYRSIAGKINGFDEATHIIQDFIKSLETNNS